MNQFKCIITLNASYVRIWGVTCIFIHLLKFLSQQITMNTVLRCFEKPVSAVFLWIFGICQFFLVRMFYNYLQFVELKIEKQSYFKQRYHDNFIIHILFSESVCKCTYKMNQLYFWTNRKLPKLTIVHIADLWEL